MRGEVYVVVDRTEGGASVCMVHILDFPVGGGGWYVK